MTAPAVITPTERSPRVGVLRRGVRTLHPAYFAMVMATGVVGIALHLFHVSWLAQILLWLNVAAFIILCGLTVARVSLYPRIFFLDLVDHNRGVGFFTIVAGMGVLGTQLVVVRGFYAAGVAFWVVATLLWALLTYGIFTGLTVKEEKPSLAEGINGGWLIAVVATQSVSRLGVLLLPVFPGYEKEILFFSLSLWLCGGMLYIWMISLIFYRYTFFRFLPSDLMPPYWVNMGAMAISTLAGATLIENASKARFVEGLLPFLQGFTLFFWATATWWIPMLVVLAVWRHVYKRFRLAYDPLYWGAVFPLGMYTVSTYELARVMKLEFLFWVPRCFVYVAVGAWLATFAGLIHSVVRAYRDADLGEGIP